MHFNHIKIYKKLAMRFKILSLPVIAVLLASCNSKAIQVNPVDFPKQRANGIVYSLPRTVIKLKADVTCTFYTPGPYSMYAQKYMGISGISNQKFEDYSISSIDITPLSEPDPSALFSAFIGDKAMLDFVQVTASGLVLPVNRYSVASSTRSGIPAQDLSIPRYVDLSTEPFIAEDKSTFYSRVQRDSSFVRVPVQRSVTIEKNAEEKAREAAEFIFSLRKKRVDLLSLDVDHSVDGDAVMAILAEISRLEEEYLSLFIGKYSSETITRYIDFVPSNPNGETSIAFRFSPTKGIVPSSDLSGNPILIEVEPDSIPESYKLYFDAIKQASERNQFDQVFYRIPLVSTVRVTDGKAELASRRVPVYQYGPTAKIPVKHLVN